MAHLKTKATHQDPTGRLHWKLSLVQGLYERGWTREDVIKLFRFIDWLMVLPTDLAQVFKIAAREYEEEKKMQYISSIEQMAMEEGTEQGLQLGVLKTRREDALKVLKLRFRAIPDSIVDGINSIEDETVLESLHEQAVTTVGLEEFQQVLNTIVG